MNTLTHFDKQGQAHMVDVGDKALTRRVAIASGQIHMQASTLQLILAGDAKKETCLVLRELRPFKRAKKQQT